MPAPAAHMGVATRYTPEDSMIHGSQVYASPSEMADAMLGAIADVLPGGAGAGADGAAGSDGAADETPAGADLPTNH